MSKYFLESLIEDLRVVANEKDELLPNGTQLISKVPPLPDGMLSDAYLHVVYPPLLKAEIDALASKIGKFIPGPFSEFLSHANGLSLYAASLTVAGFSARPCQRRQCISAAYKFGVWKYY